MSQRTFSLLPVPPFRLDLTVWTLRRRPDSAVDRWDGQTYRRTLLLSSGLVGVAVSQVEPPEAPQLQVSVEGQPLHSKVKAAVASALERLLGLHIDLAEFYRCFARQDQLGQLVRHFRGVKPPRFATVFETVINAIASQQVTRTLGIRLLNRLTLNYGAAVREGDVTVHAFPRPEDLARLCPADFRQLGFSQQKGRAMIELAQSITEGVLDLEGLAELPDEEAVKRLRGLRGVGPWTAEYVLLRGLGRTHVFPGDVVGARNNLHRWLHLAVPLDDAAVRRTLDRWHPYGGLIYFHLLLDRLAEADSCSQDHRSRKQVALTISMFRTHYSREVVPMAQNFRVGDHVGWNSEAGRVRGTIKKKITSEIMFKGYKVHASKEEPQYLIKSDKTDHMAMHKGSALKKLKKSAS